MKRLFLCLSLLLSGLCGCIWGQPLEAVSPSPISVAVHLPLAEGEKVDLTPSEVYEMQYELLKAEEAMFPKVLEGKGVDIRWIPCGEENAFFDPDGHTIYLCTEMEAYPDAALLFAAHELGHAIGYAYLSESSEREADDIGMLSMLELGLHDELVRAADYYDMQVVTGHYPGDPHPPTKYRSWEAKCLATGWKALQDNQVNPEDAGCAMFYVGMKSQYQALMEAATGPLVDVNAAIQDVVDKMAKYRDTKSK